MVPAMALTILKVATKPVSSVNANGVHSKGDDKSGNFTGFGIQISFPYLSVNFTFAFFFTVLESGK